MLLEVPRDDERLELLGCVRGGAPAQPCAAGRVHARARGEARARGVGLDNLSHPRAARSCSPRPADDTVRWFASIIPADEKWYFFVDYGNPSVNMLT